MHSSRLIETRALLTGEYQSLTEFDRRVNHELDKAIRKIEAKKESYASMDEESLTNVIELALGMAGIDARAGTQINGEVDLVATHGELKWILEAKIFNSYVSAIEGMLQLSTRYSIGDENNSHGAVLLYVKSGDLHGKLNVLRDKYSQGISDSNGQPILENLECKDCDLGVLSFITTHKHYASGLPFTVRHRGVSLLFDPQDKSGKNRKRTSTETYFDTSIPDSIPPLDNLSDEDCSKDGWLSELLVKAS